MRTLLWYVPYYFVVFGVKKKPPITYIHICVWPTNDSCLRCLKRSHHFVLMYVVCEAQYDMQSHIRKKNQLACYKNIYSLSIQGSILPAERTSLRDEYFKKVIWLAVMVTYLCFCSHVFCFKDIRNYTWTMTLQREIYHPAYATDLSMDKRQIKTRVIFFPLRNSVNIFGYWETSYFYFKYHIN